MKYPYLVLCLVLLSLCMSTVTFSAEQGLVAHYTFDDGTGSVLKDSSGNGNNGRIVGAEWMKLKNGYALKFDGKTNYIDCGNNASLDITGPVTIEAWINPSTLAGARDKGVVGKGSPYFDHFGLTFDMGRVYFYAAYPANNLNVNSEINAWQHVAAVFDGKEIRLYLNGNLGGVRPSVSEKTTSGNTLFIGKNENAFFEGMIDEIKVYNRAVSPEEIYADYQVEGRKKFEDFNRLRVTKHIHYSAGKILADVDFRPLTPLPRASYLEVRVVPDGRSNAVLRQTMKALPASGKANLEFKASSLKPGNYVVRASIFDSGGKQVGEPGMDTAIWPAKPKWLGSKEGKSARVLSPWTPVQANEKGSNLAVSIWGRTYRFDGSVFPTSIETGGRQILSTPMTLTASIDGSPAQWKSNSTPGYVRSDTGSTVRCKRDLSAIGHPVRLTASISVEYDGMVRTDWKLVSKEDVTIDNLTLEIRLPEQYAQYEYHFPDFVHEPVHRPGLLPKEGMTRHFNPSIWLGDEERGLEWFCESDRNWFNTRPEKAVEITRQGGDVVMKLNIIDKPTRLSPKSPLAYTFGLQATPVKPNDKDCWDYRIITPPVYGKDYTMLTDKVDGVPMIDYLASIGVKTIALFNWTDWLAYPAPVGHEQQLRDLVRELHKRDMKVLIYLGYQLTERAPEWPIYGEEVSKLPAWRNSDHYPGEPFQWVNWVCYNSIWQDFFVTGIGRMIDEYDVDGVYFDGTASPWPCENRMHGCGYLKADGSVEKTFPIFGVRENMKRVYAAVKSRKPDGMVDVHQSASMVIPCISWATSYWDGEMLTSEILPLDARSLDFFRTEFMGKQWGVPAEFLHYMVGTAKQALAVSLLHDVLVRGHSDIENTKLIASIWRAGESFGRKDAEWLPYWKNSQYVTTGPKDIYVSLYKHPKNGVLAVVSNLSKKDSDVEVDFDLGRLGLERPSAKDALTGEAITMTGGVLKMSLPNVGWRLIRLQ